MLKVLIVEDEEMIRKGIVLTVDWAAMDCVVVGEASNGLEALDAVRRYDPSLIITDLKMPQMDGIEMVTRLRQAGNNAYVIILTAYDTFSYAQAALGGEVRIGTVDGDVIYEVKPGTQPNTRIRLKGKGVPSLRNRNVRGDHYVTLNLKVPTSLSNESKEALRKFDETLGGSGTKKKSFKEKLKETFEG